jgi:hypothetical protein
VDLAPALGRNDPLVEQLAALAQRRVEGPIRPATNPSSDIEMSTLTIPISFLPVVDLK